MVMIEASGSHTQVSKQRDWQSLSNGYDETQCGSEKGLERFHI